MSDPPNEELIMRGEELILAGFRSAQERGYENWREMTTAVLKNRILTLTEGDFDERTWGEASFRQFLALYPTLVQIDNSTRPPTARLLRDSSSNSQDAERQAPADTGIAMTPQRRVRSDLWRAILDYSSGKSYVWTGESVEAIEPDEPVPADQPLVPTVTPETYALWRDEFSQQQVKLVSPPEATQIQRWQSEALSTRYLPHSLRGIWNAALKRHVVEMLEGWFTEQGLAPPPDLVVEILEARRPVNADTEELRRFIHACVAGMTRQELESLRLPPAAALNAARRIDWK